MSEQFTTHELTMIGRICKRVDKDGVFDILLQFPKAFHMEARPVDPRAALGPTEAVMVVSDWETISLSEFIDARCR